MGSAKEEDEEKEEKEEKEEYQVVDMTGSWVHRG
jgi:hypothetical protein